MAGLFAFTSCNKQDDVAEELLGIPPEFRIRLRKGHESDLELIELRKIKQAS